MDVRETTHLLALDDAGQPLARLAGENEWRDIAAQLLRLDSRWLVIEQRRDDERPPLPRWEDINLCRTLSRRLRAMEVKLADHVILGRRGRFSFRDAGLL